MLKKQSEHSARSDCSFSHSLRDAGMKFRIRIAYRVGFTELCDFPMTDCTCVLAPTPRVIQHTKIGITYGTHTQQQRQTPNNHRTV